MMGTNYFSSFPSYISGVWRGQMDGTSLTEDFMVARGRGQDATRKGTKECANVDGKIGLIRQLLRVLNSFDVK